MLKTIFLKIYFENNVYFQMVFENSQQTTMLALLIGPSGQIYIL